MFGPRFKSAKCKTFLRMCTGRIKLLRNKKSIQLKDLRREIADLLANGKEDSARIRVEAVMRELDLMDAFEIIDLFAELLCVRLALIESTKDVPTDMREAVSSLLYASPRVRELPELAPVREQLMAKYGKEFAMSCSSDMSAHACGVNDRLITKLAIIAPSPLTKIKLLEEIAQEWNVQWDSSRAYAQMMPPPTAGAAEFLAPGEGVAAGPAAGAVAAAMGMPMGAPGVQGGRAPSGPFAPHNLAAGVFAPPPQTEYQPPAFVPAAAPGLEAGAGAGAGTGTGAQEYAEAVAAARAAQAAAERAAAAAEATAARYAAAGGGGGGAGGGGGDVAGDLLGMSAYDLAPGPPEKAVPPSAPPAVPTMPPPAEPVAPPAAPPAAPAAAPAAPADEFDDLAKRFEALKKRG